MLDLKALLDDTEQHAKTELKSNPTVVDVGDDLDLEDLAVGCTAVGEGERRGGGRRGPKELDQAI
jgi:hypothetical protein